MSGDYTRVSFDPIKTFSGVHKQQGRVSVDSEFNEWEEILDRTRRRHKYLFEHHPEKSFRSFVATLVGGLFPWSFWRSLHPTQRPDLRRLWKYRSVILGLAWLPLTSTTAESARSDMERRATRGIILSSVTTRYLLGFAFHAGSLMEPLRAATPTGLGSRP